MGVWSHAPFGNDDALDWADGLEGPEGLLHVEEALERVLKADGYLEAPEASEAVAAVEVLAKLLGKGTQSDSYARSADNWVKSVSVQPSPTILSKAGQALERVLGNDSELRELWQESGNASEWQGSVKALQAAVAA
jgi:hypothetical protein